MFTNAGNIPLWEEKMLKTLVLLIILGLAPKLLTFPCGHQKVLKTLVLLIILGLGAPNLSTFPLWESKKGSQNWRCSPVGICLNRW